MNMCRDDDLGRRIRQLCSLTGKQLEYRTLLSTLFYVSRPEQFTPDVMRPDTLVWSGHASVTVDRPLVKLTPRDEVTVVDVTTVDDATKPARTKSRMVRMDLNPALFVALLMARDKKVMRDVGRLWRRSPAECQRALRVADGTDLIKCLGSEEAVAARRALGVLGMMSEQEAVPKLRAWFPRQTEVVDKCTDLEEFIDAVTARTRLETWACIGLFMIIKDMNQAHLDEVSPKLTSLLMEMTRIQRRPFEMAAAKNAFTEGRDRRLCADIREMLAQSTLWETASASHGVFHAVDDLLRSERLTIDSLDTPQLTDAVVVATLRASTHISLDEGAEEEQLFGALVYALRVIKLMAGQLRRERDLAAKHRPTKAGREEAQEASADEVRLQAQVDELRAVIAKRQARANEVQLELDRTALRADQLEVENAQLREFMDALEQADEQPEEDEPTGAELAAMGDEAFPEGTLLVGGHPRFQKFFKQAHPEVTLVDGTAKSFNTAMINASTPLVLINPRHMSHPVWWKLMPMIKRHNVPYSYRTSLALPR